MKLPINLLKFVVINMLILMSSSVIHGQEIVTDGSPNSDLSRAADYLDIVVYNKNGKNLYEVEGVPKPMLRVDDRVILEFLRSKGKDAPVKVKIECTCQIKTIDFVKGLLQKIGFQNIRYYFYDDDFKRMIEIRIGRGAGKAPGKAPE